MSVSIRVYASTRPARPDREMRSHGTLTSKPVSAASRMIELTAKHRLTVRISAKRRMMIATLARTTSSCLVSRWALDKRAVRDHYAEVIGTGGDRPEG